MRSLETIDKLPSSYKNLEGEKFDFTPVRSYVKKDKLFVFGLIKQQNISIVHSPKLRYLFYPKKKNNILKLQGIIKDNWCFYPMFQSKKPVKQLNFSDYPDQLQPHFKKIFYPISLEDAQNGWNQLLWFELAAINYLVDVGRQKKEPQQSFTIKNLPFDLTEDQKQAWQDIQLDLISKKTTNRLIYGEVGSGKSILMFLASKHTYLNNKTTIVLVPNCLLARQLYENFCQWDPDLPIQLVIKNNTINKQTSIIIGTHALFYRDLPDDIALLIVDEQQKFSIEQRQEIRTISCDLLMLTATPNPRTLFMAQNKHINTSYLNKKRSVTTAIMSYKSYDALLDRILTKAQTQLVLWIINSVEIAEKLAEKTAQHVHTICIYGSHKQKLKLLSQINNMKAGLVVSTTVLEVGIDCDFSIVVIEKADHLGLAQLHQLRGRVGRRDNKKAYCVLLGNDLHKLQNIKYAEDFRSISQLDLETRGASSILSHKQHGINLHFAKKVRNYKIYDRIITLEDLHQSNQLQPSAEVLQFFSKFKKISY